MFSKQGNFGLQGYSEFSEHSSSLRVSDLLRFELSEVCAASLSCCNDGGARALSSTVRGDCDLCSVSTCLRSLVWTRVAASFSSIAASQSRPIFVCCSSSYFCRLESAWRSCSLVCRGSSTVVSFLLGRVEEDWECSSSTM